MDQVREVLRYHHYAYRTEKTYCQWIRRFIHFSGGKTHPRYLGANDIERFLSHLAVNGKVSASTQRQALNALIFLYDKVLDISLDGKIQPIRSKKKPNLPTVLGKHEIKCFFRYIDGTHALMAKLLYGSGLRLMESVRLRVKDIDFDRKRIHILGKGDKWRSTILPDLRKKVMVKYIFLQLWLGSSKMLPEKFNGNMFFHRKNVLLILAQVVAVAITLWNQACRKQLREPLKKQGLTNVSPAIPCVIVLPLQCWRMVSTSVFCKSSWAMQMLKQLSFIHM